MIAESGLDADVSVFYTTVHFTLHIGPQLENKLLSVLLFLDFHLTSFMFWFSLPNIYVAEKIFP
jgi:hypothetical protein